MRYEESEDDEFSDFEETNIEELPRTNTQAEEEKDRH